MAIFDVTDSAGLRAAIQQAGATDTINLVGPGPYSVGTLAKVKSFTPAPTGAAGYTINGNGFSVTNTRIYQENLEGPGPGTLSNVTLSYTSAAANNTAILRATSGNYLLDGVTITGQHGGWAGNGNLYMSLAVSTAANPVNATLTIQSSTVNVTGQGNGFNGTSGGSAFLHSFNNIGTVQLLNNSFDEAGFLSSFNFFTSPGSAPLGTYAITNNTFFRSANQNARTRGNRLENVSVTLSGNTFQNGSFIDLLGSISGVSFGANTFDTVAGGFGIRLTNPNSGTPLTGDLPDITGSITFNGPGLPLKLLSSTPLSKSLKANLASVNTITITGLGTFDSLTAGGQAADNIDRRGTNARDWVNGDDGNDTIYGGDNTDYLLGGADNDLVYGGLGADTLLGGAGNDTLAGDTGFDVIDGGLGDDSIIGGYGQDTLTGGGGTNTFYYGPQTDGVRIIGPDTLTDFTTGIDKFHFNSADWGSLPVGALNPLNFSNTGAATAAIPQFIYTPGTGLLTFDADGTNPGAAVTIGTLTNLTALAATDIFIV